MQTVSGFGSLCFQHQLGAGILVVLTTPRAKATEIPRRDFRTSDKSDS
jgi:hypothetical protein